MLSAHWPTSATPLDATPSDYVLVSGSQSSSIPDAREVESPAVDLTDQFHLEVTGNTIVPFKTSRVWGVDFAAINMRDAIDFLDAHIASGEPGYAITANLNYIMLLDEHPQLQPITRSAKMILCDGMPILWRSKLSGSPLPERVAGSDLIYALAERAAERGYRIFLLGAAEGVAQKAADRLCERFPALEIAGVECPPFRKLSEQEESLMHDRIRASRADILLVAFGQPKGEFWISKHFHTLGIPLSIQLGASFNFVAGSSKRAPKLFQVLGLEWLYRALKDPNRLLPRYGKNAGFLLKTLVHELTARK